MEMVQVSDRLKKIMYLSKYNQVFIFSKVVAERDLNCN